VGTPGTQVLESNVAYTGSHSLSFVGDGSTQTAIQQQFNVDNAGQIAPLAQYAFNCWVKINNASGGTGVLEIALVDGTGTIILDQQGNANSVTKNVSTLTTSFVAMGGAFRLPRLVPASVYLRIRFSTALAATYTVYVDRLSFTQMSQFYQGGPYICGFSGNSELIREDSFTVTTTNTAGGFQRLFDKWFDMKGLQLLLPSSGSPTQADSLIT
jgi:hypothetical protein